MGNDKKHIIIFCGSLQAGGAERVISEITRKLKLYYDITIVLYYSREIFYQIDPEIKILEIEKVAKSKKLIAKALWIRRYVKTICPDCVVSFLAPFNVFIFYSLLFTNIPLILCERNDPRYFSNIWILNKLRDIAYRYTSGLVFQTHMCQNFFSDYIRNKSVIINNACFVPEDKLGIGLTTEKKRKIVSVARLHRSKNIPMLIRAFSFLHYNTEYNLHRLVIYGDGPEKEKLIDLTHLLKLDDYIEFPGKVENIFDAISDAELFVLPSNYEGMPNALMEAIAVGLPVISTKVSGAEELIDDGINGYIVDVGDEESLRLKMQILLSNLSLRESMGKKSVEHSRQYNLNYIIQDWKVYINKIISSHK